MRLALLTSLLLPSVASAQPVELAIAVLTADSSAMRRLLLFLAVAATGCATVTTIGIEPGEQFVLGGRQGGTFQAQLENRGEGPVRVAEVTATGDTVLVAELAPGASATATFSEGSAALLINRGAQQATIRGRIRGGGTLGMRYTPVGGEATR